MNASSIKRQTALDLRRRGLTYREIIEKLHIAKGTLSGWVRSGISEEDERQVKIKTAKIGRAKIIKINKARSMQKKREETKWQKEFAREIPEINSQQLFWLGMGLYLAEGSKTGRWKATFCNSNPALNKMMMKFFREICQVSEERIHIQMVLHENVSETKAMNFWSKELGVDRDNFFRASFVKSRASKGKRPKNRLPYGTVQISITNKTIANKIKGWMQGIRRQFYEDG